MTKATHSGTCQACGRVQAVNNKTQRLAKHGYTVDYGYFSGTCSGSDRKPLEVETSHNIDTVAAIRIWADEQDAKANGEILKVIVDVYVRGDARSIGHHENQVMNREQFIKYSLGFSGAQGDEAWDHKVYSFKEALKRNATFARKDAVILDELRDKTFGNDLTSREVPADAPQRRSESFKYSAEKRGAMGQAYDRARELKLEGIRSRVTGDARYSTITYRK